MKIMKLSFLLLSILAPAPVTSAPVVTPTPCKDDPEFRFKQERDKTCEWVAEKPLERCEKEWKRIELSYYCPRSCGVCGPSPAPSSPPSGSPSTPPTAAPVTPAPTGCDPELCFNNPDFKHQNCGKFDCKWVAKKTESRCYKEDNNKGLTVFAECPESCAASDFCLDVASKHGIEGCDGDKKYLCPITCGLCELCPETSSRVSSKPFQVSRGGCPAPVEAVQTTPAPTTTPVPTSEFVLCDWTGVGCTSRSETIIEAFGGGVQGTIPTEIGLLTALKDLILGKYLILQGSNGVDVDVN